MKNIAFFFIYYYSLISITRFVFHSPNVELQKRKIQKGIISNRTIRHVNLGEENYIHDLSPPQQIVNRTMQKRGKENNERKSCRTMMRKNFKTAHTQNKNVEKERMPSTT